MKNLFNLSALSLVLALTLTACGGDKPSDTPKAEAKTETTAEAPKPAGYDYQNSPTIKIMADAFKAGTWAAIQATSNIQSDEQLQCLVANPDTALFVDAATTEIKKSLNDDLLKKSDEFYDTEVGKKVLKYMEYTQAQQVAMIQGKTVEGEPVTLTAEDQQKMAEFGQSEDGKKIAAATQSSADPQSLQTLFQELATKEKTRCKVS